MKLRLIISLGILFLSVPAFAIPDYSQKFQATSLKKAKILIQHGNLKISAVPNASPATVQIQKIRFNEDFCQLRIEQEGPSLVIESKDKRVRNHKISPTTEGNCLVHFHVKIPRNLALDVTVGSGSLSATGIESDVNFNSQNGSVELAGSLGKVIGKADSGNITVSGLNGPAKFKVGSGNIGLTYFNPQPKGILDIKSGSGNIVLTLPKKAKIKTHFMSGSGELKSEFADETDNMDPHLQVFVVSGSGNLSITGSAPSSQE